MTYRTRSARRLASKTRRNFFVSLLVILFLIFVTINWVLPVFINSLGFITSPFKQAKDSEVPVSENPTLAPPVLNIPYEATNTAKINIKGFATAHSKVRIFVDDELKSEADVGFEGSFIAKNIKLSLGLNSIYGKAVDEKNQESLQSKQIKLIYDNEKPFLEVSEPQDNQITTEKKIKISGKAEKDTSVFINDVQAITNSDGVFSKEQSLNSGDNIILIRAVDSALNSTEISRKVLVQP